MNNAFVEVLTAQGQSHDSIVAGGRRLVMADGSIRRFTWEDYKSSQEDCRVGDVYREHYYGTRFFERVA